MLHRTQTSIALRPQPVKGINPVLWAKMRQYLQEDVETEPYYSEVEPFCYQGGVGIYFLRKIKDMG